MLDPTDDHLWRDVVLIACLGLMAVAAILIGTAQWGVGVSPDSVGYIASARNLAAGKGLVTDSGSRMAAAAPLYPTVLSAFAACGIGIEHGTRWMNAILFGASVVMVGVILRLYTRSCMTALFGALLFAASHGILQMHLYLNTEPLFYFFALLGVLLLGAYVDRPGLLLLFGTSVVVGLTVLTRYAAASWVPAGMVVIVILTREKWIKRIVNACVFGVISAAPTAIWILICRLETPAGSRKVLSAGFYPIGLYHLRNFLGAFSRWFLPVEVPQVVRGVFLLVLAVTFTALIIYLVRQPRKKGEPVQDNRRLRAVPTLLGIYLMFFALMLVVVAMFIVEQLSLGTRIQSPVFVFGMILVLCKMQRLLRRADAVKWVRKGCIVCCVVFACYHAGRGSLWVYRNYRNGSGFTARRWQRSETVAKLRSLGRGLTVFSNHDRGVRYLVPETDSRDLPIVQTRAGRKLANFDKMMKAMEETLRSTDALLVYFSNDKRNKFPDAIMLEEKLPLDVVARCADGTIYRIRD